MSKKRIFILFVCLVVGACCFFAYQKKSNKTSSIPVIMNKDPLQKNVDRGIATSSKTSKHSSRRKDTILLKLKDDATALQIQDLKSLYDKFDLRLNKKLLNGKGSRLKVFNKAFEDQEESIVEQIVQTGAVEFAEPDYNVPPSLIPNDSFYTQEWHHQKINSESAWNYSQGNTNVLVVLCDAGFDLSHPDLSSRFLLPGYNTVNDNTIIDDVNDHGTMTAGVLAAAGNNSQGVAGVTWQNKILPIQISNQADGVSTYSDIAECITYANNRGAKVANISYDYLYTSATINDAALSMKNSGGLVVVAAGNSAADISAWGASPNLIVVGATDSYDTQSWFSNFGTPVDLFAPGQDIYSTTANNNYNMVNGTSFATPLTAGVLALIYSLNPSWTAAQVENYLISSLAIVGPIHRLDAGAALKMASDSLTPPPPPPPPAPMIIDNLKPQSTDSKHSYVGKWCSSTQSGFYGTNSILSCGSKLDSYRFKPSIPVAKTYEIYIRYLSKSTLSTHATVKVNSASGLTTKSVNMTTGGATWVLLGNFSLKAGTTNYVEVTDAGGAVNIDAVKFQAVP